MNENGKKWARIIAKAWQDESFKKHLLANPDQVLQEYGLPIPKKGHVKIVENTETTHHLILPHKPSGAMSEEELNKIVAAAGAPFIKTPGQTGYGW